MLVLIPCVTSMGCRQSGLSYYTWIGQLQLLSGSQCANMLEGNLEGDITIEGGGMAVLKMEK